MAIVAPQRNALMPELSPHAELAVLARALFREGWDDYDVGHITYRQPDQTFLTLPFELGWDEVRASDIVRMDHDGNKLEGQWDITPPIRLHLEFHRARPNCDVTVHQHPRYTTYWSAAGRVPPAYDQRAASIPDDDIAFYDDYEGGVAGVEAARAAVAGIGDKNCAILRNHGAFVVGDSIAQAFSRATALEWRCKQAWHVEAIGGTSTVPRQGREQIEEFMSSVNGVIPMLWPWAVRREARIDPDVFS